MKITAYNKYGGTLPTKIVIECEAGKDFILLQAVTSYAKQWVDWHCKEYCQGSATHGVVHFYEATNKIEAGESFVL